LLLHKLYFQTKALITEKIHDKHIFITKSISQVIKRQSQQSSYQHSNTSLPLKHLYSRKSNIRILCNQIST